MQSNKILSNGLWLNQQPVKIISKVPDAEVPYQDFVTEPGYNLIIVQRCDSRTEDLTGDVNTFSTGLVITPHINYHVEILPHPQLYKSGYMLVGPLLISPESEDEIVLPLFKYKDVPDLELPFTAAIMVVRETEYSSLNVEGVKSAKKEDVKPEKPTRGGKAVRGKGNHLF